MSFPQSPNENPSAQMQIFASEFANKITRKNIHAKLPAKTIVPGLMGGVKDDSQHASAFIDHGPDKIPLGNLEQSVVYNLAPKITSAMTRLKWDKQAVSLNEFVSNQIVMIDNGIMNVLFFQDSKVDMGGNRTPYPLSSYIQIELPSEILGKLKNEIQLIPDLLEFFYQAAFPQLDSTDETPGARRIKSKGFYFLDGSNTQDLKTLFEKIKSEPMVNIQNKQIKDYFKSVQYFQYKNGPYGSGDSID